jgi:hypothetical protein
LKSAALQFLSCILLSVVTVHPSDKNSRES